MSERLKPDEVCVGIQRVKAALRVWADALEPDAVSAALGTPPTDAWKKGELRPRGVAPVGMWSLKSAAVSPEPSEHVRDILDRLKVVAELWSELRPSVECDIFMGIWRVEDEDQFFSLSPRQLLVLGKHEIPLNIWNYGIPPADQLESRVGSI